MKATRAFLFKVCEEMPEGAVVTPQALEVIRCYTPSLGTTLPLELGFNGLRNAERLTKAPSKVSNVQVQAVQLKTVESTFAVGSSDSFSARNPALFLNVCAPWAPFVLSERARS
jgi:hypothetical protein